MHSSPKLSSCRRSDKHRKDDKHNQRNTDVLPPDGASIEDQERYDGRQQAR